MTCSKPVGTNKHVFRFADALESSAWLGSPLTGPSVVHSRVHQRATFCDLHLGAWLSSWPLSYRCCSVRLGSTRSLSEHLRMCSLLAFPQPRMEDGTDCSDSWARDLRPNLTPACGLSPSRCLLLAFFTTARGCTRAFPSSKLVLDWKEPRIFIFIFIQIHVLLYMDFFLFLKMTFFNSLCFV